MAEAFGKYVNSACIARGKELLKEAKEAHNKRRDDSSRDIEQAAKDIATGLVGVGKRRVIRYPEKIKVTNVMSNADRRARGIPEDESLEDYQGGNKCS